jgi:hypothetical protein
MKSFALILAANLTLSGVCLASPPKFSSHTSGITKLGGKGGATISGSGNGTGNIVTTTKKTIKLDTLKNNGTNKIVELKKVTNSGNGAGNTISVGKNISNNSPKLFLPKGVTKVNTTFDSKSNTGFKKYQYNGKSYKAKYFGWGFKNWSKWCWYPTCGCYCYWAPCCDCWCYWYQPWGCYLPVECTVIFPPEPNGPGPDDDDMGGPGGPGPDGFGPQGQGPGGAAAFSVGPKGPPGLPPSPTGSGLPEIPGVDLPVAPGPQDLVPVSGKKS